MANDFNELGYSGEFDSYFRAFLGKETEEDIKIKKQKEEEERKRKEREAFRKQYTEKQTQVEQEAKAKTSLKGQVKHFFTTEAAQARRGAVVSGAKKVVDVGKGFVEEVVKPYKEISESQKIISKGLEERKSRGVATAFGEMVGGKQKKPNQETLRNILNIPEQVENAKIQSPDTPVSREQEEVVKEIQQDRQLFNKNYVRELNAARQAGNVEAEKKLTKQFQFINNIGGDDKEFEISDDVLRDAYKNAAKWGAIALVDVITMAIPGLKPLKAVGSIAKGGKAANLAEQVAEVKQVVTKTGQWLNKNKAILGLEATGGAVSGGLRAEAEDTDILTGVTTGAAFAPAAVTGFGLIGKGVQKLWRKAGVRIAERAAQKVSQEIFNKETQEIVAGKMAVTKLAKDINDGIAIELPPETVRVFNDEITDFLGKDFINEAAARIKGIEEVIDNPAIRIKMPKLTEFVKETMNIPTPDYRELMKSKFSMILNDNELDAFKNTGVLPKGAGLLPPGIKPDYQQLTSLGKKHLVVLDKIDIEDPKSLVPQLKTNASGANVVDFRTNWVDEALQTQKDESSLAAGTSKIISEEVDDFSYKSLRDVNTELEDITKKLDTANDPVEINQLARQQEELESIIYRKAEEQAQAINNYTEKTQRYEGALEQRSIAVNAIGEKEIGRIKSAYSRGIDVEKVGKIDERAMEYSRSLRDMTAREELDMDDFYELIGKLPTKKEIEALKPTRADLEMTKDTYALKRPAVEVVDVVAEVPVAAKREGFEKVEVTGKIEPEAPPAVTPRGTGKKKLSKFATRVKEKYADLFEDKKDITYSESSNIIESGEAANLVESDFKKAISLAKGGELSKEYNLTHVGLAVMEKAKEAGDNQLFADVSTNLSLRLTRFGQEVQAASLLSDVDPSRQISQIVRQRVKKVIGKEKLEDVLKNEEENLLKNINKNRLKDKNAQDLIDKLIC